MALLVESPPVPHRSLAPMDRVLLVGDVHGCLDELTALLALVRDPERRLVLVGDLVAKGPASWETVRFCQAVGAHTVRGNHDHRFLSFRAQFEATGEWTDPRLAKELTRFEQADWDFLSSAPLTLALTVVGDTVPTVVVHGGFVPDVPLREQLPHHLMTLRSVLPDGKPSKDVEGTPWLNTWRGPERVVFGHDAVRGLQQAPLGYGLDTGCVYGRHLTGLLLPEAALVSVSARRMYQQPR